MKCDPNTKYTSGGKKKLWHYENMNCGLVKITPEGECENIKLCDYEMRYDQKIIHKRNMILWKYEMQSGYKIHHRGKYENKKIWKVWKV